jgi:hypothetical protein
METRKALILSWLPGFLIKGSFPFAFSLFRVFAVSPAVVGPYRVEGLRAWRASDGRRGGTLARLQELIEPEELITSENAPQVELILKLESQPLGLQPRDLLDQEVCPRLIQRVIPVHHRQLAA